LGGDQDQQLAAAILIHLGGLAAAPVAGGERTGLASPLQKATDPGGADTKQFSNLLSGATVLVTGADDAFAEVLRVGLHREYSFPTLLDCLRYKRMQNALARVFSVVWAAYDSYLAGAICVSL
jgi:hypothetical protein